MLQELVFTVNILFSNVARLVSQTGVYTALLYLYNVLEREMFEINAQYICYIINNNVRPRHVLLRLYN